LEAAVVFLCEEALSETWRMGGFGRTTVSLAEYLAKQRRVFVLCSLENRRKSSVKRRNGVVYIISPFGYGYANKFRSVIFRWTYFIPHRLWIRFVVKSLRHKQNIFVECAEYGSEWLFVPPDNRDHIRFHTPTWFDRNTRKMKPLLKVSAVDWPTYLAEKYLLKPYLNSWRIKTTVGTQMVQDLSFFTGGLVCKVNYFEVIKQCESVERSIDITYLGSVIEEKGVYDLIPISRSFNITFGKKPNIMVIGHGRKSVIQSLEAEIDCKYLGYLSANKVKDELCNSKYIACTSNQEAFGMVVIEGMNAGCRVILNQSSYEDFHHFENVLLYNDSSEIPWLEKWEAGTFEADLLRMQQNSVITIYE
jgi:glycosyltransferase involved in cell wall biosynthesis